MDTLKQLHTSVAQALESCFTDFDAEFAAHDAHIRNAERRAEAADEARRNLEVEINELRQGNMLLREQLKDTNGLKEGKILTTISKLEETYAPHHVFGDNQPSDTGASGLQTIRNRYSELYQQAEMLIEASESLRVKVKRDKDKIWQLTTYLNQQEDREGEAIKYRRVTTTGPRKHGSPAESASRAAKRLQTTNDGLEAIMSTRKPIALASVVNQGQISSSTGDESDNASEKRVQRELSESAYTPSDASDDLPTNTAPASTTQKITTLKRKNFASARSVPRNRPSVSINNGGSGHPIMIKSETLSSSPLRTYSSHPAPPGTQDLDDIGISIVTPTKKIRCYRDSGIRATEDLSTNNESTIQFVASERNQSTPKAGVLQPVNSSLRTVSANRGSTKKFGGMKRISSITEDGDEVRPSSLLREKNAKLPQGSLAPRHPSRDHRLSNLLANSSPSHHQEWQPRGVNASAPTYNRTRHLSTDSTLLLDSETEATSNLTPRAPKSSRNKSRLIVQGDAADESLLQPERESQMGMMPDDEPYRARPLGRLDLEHFRINPEFNQGLDYAYNEVVRRKDERKCASGCTRPSCCGGKFLAMARFGMPAEAYGKSISDQQILEGYVGDDIQLIEGLTPRQHQELLVEAKAKFFSDQFGKHRYQHHRAPSPPGFWRTDMPGTQDLEDDREEAQELGRNKVKERYREAMRPGGQWKFADE
ncbi:DNA repair protein endonuclease SAE2/CtIP C-terminus-domain-containing protein [Aspergillus californicus]